ncbi:MAG: hypothetical protein ABWY00_15585 [Dongiaceae bacterium]
MTDEWKHQIRLTLPPGIAEIARRDPADPALRPLAEILARHQAVLKCQYDAFADYVAEAEEQGIDGYPLYLWTKATIEEPAKKTKYLQSFTLRINGEEVYARDLAAALEAELTPLVGGDLIERLANHDTNPANNPQPPARFRPQQPEA